MDMSGEEEGDKLKSPTDTHIPPWLKCWRRLLQGPWTAQRSSQPILREISPGCSLEGLMLRLKLKYFGHLMWRADASEKTLMLGGIVCRRRRGRPRMRWLDGITNSMDMSLGELGCWWWTGRPGVHSWGCKESDTTEWLKWTELKWKRNYDKPKQYTKMQRYHLADNGLYIQSVVFPVVIYKFETGP